MLADRVEGKELRIRKIDLPSYFLSREVNADLFDLN